MLADGGFDERLTVAEDQDMWIRLAMLGHLGYLDAPLVRVHATQNNYDVEGLRFIARGAMFRFEPLEDLRLLIGATPPASWLKRLVRAKRI